jgi:hypothetical protein
MRPKRRVPMSASNVAGQPSGRQPRVEVIDEPLWSASDLREAVLTGRSRPGLVCALAGLGFGFYLGLREGRR